MQKDALTALKITRNKKLPEDQQKDFFDKLRTRNIGRESKVKLNIEDYMKDETAPSKAGKGQFTKAEVLIQRLQKNFKDRQRSLCSRKLSKLYKRTTRQSRTS